MEPDKIAAWIQTWIAQRRNDPSVTITGDTDLYTSGLLDSLGIIELIESLEDEFDMMFTEEQMQAGLTSVSDFTKAFKEQP